MLSMIPVKGRVLLAMRPVTGVVGRGGVAVVHDAFYN